MDEKAAIVTTKSIADTERAIALLGERVFGQALQGLLGLVSDVCLAFDAFGRIIMASDAAAALWLGDTEASSLIGKDIRSFFPIAKELTPEATFSLEDLPFNLDGVAKQVIIQAANGEAVTLDVRLRRLTGPGDTYLCVAHIVDANSLAARERDRLVSELERANMRLYGTLRIILGTINAEDTQSLFQNVLDELVHTIAASGALLYIAHGDGFHLTGQSSGLSDMRAARFMPFGKTIESILSDARRSLRLRVLPPKTEDLRKKALRKVDVIDEDSKQCYSLLRQYTPPFANFMIVPIYFGGQMLAIIEVGWKQMHPTRREDADLLDTVAKYLSIQLVGAFSAMQERYSEQLAHLRSECTSRLMAKDSVAEQDVETELLRIAEELDCDLYSIYIDSSTLYAELMEEGSQRMTLDPSLINVLLDAPSGEISALNDSFIAEDVLLCRPNTKAKKASLDPHTKKLKDQHIAWVLVRSADLEPFDDMEIDLVQGFSEDIEHLLLGSREHTQNKHIAQALQTGMKNELQNVEGIKAHAIYSSATERAAVGGDFYDLIRLPNNKACVIMGDVSGKGVEAASVSAAVKTALGAYAWQDIAPSVMVAHLNDFLLGFSRLETFATLFVGMIDLKSMSMTYCSAGHPPAILIRKSTGSQETLDVQSGVVGAFSEMRYHDGRIKLDDGDTLLLYTDGTTEARNPDGGFFGEEGLKDTVANFIAKDSRIELTDYILDALDHFTERQLEDDVALLSLTMAKN